MTDGLSERALDAEPEPKPKAIVRFSVTGSDGDYSVKAAEVAQALRLIRSKGALHHITLYRALEVLLDGIAQYGEEALSKERINEA